jgi:potassium-dependent mechanosensitive channel
VRAVVVTVLLLLLASVARSPAAAQSDEPGAFERMSVAWEATLEAAEKELAQSQYLDQLAYQDLARTLKSVFEAAERAEQGAQQPLAALQQQLTSLGPPPPAGAPPEEARIAALRADLSRQLAEAQARLHRAAWIRIRASELIDDLLSGEQASLQRELLTPSPPAWRAETWTGALADLGLAFRKAGAWLGAPRAESDPGPRAAALLALAIMVALAVGWLLRVRLANLAPRDPAQSDPPPASRVAAALAAGTANVVMLSLVLATAVGGLGALGRMTPARAALAFDLAVVIVALGFGRAALAPALPAWRIVPVTTDGARPVYAQGLAIALVTLAFRLLNESLLAAGLLGPELHTVIVLIDTTIIAALMIAITRTAYWQADPGAGVPARWALARLLFRLLALALPVLAFFGYGPLSDFLRFRLILTALVIGLALLVRLVLLAGLRRILTGQSGLLRPFASRYGVSDETAEAALFWGRLLINAVMALFGGYLLLLLFGVPGATVSLWAQSLLNGITIGNVTISLFNILAAVAVLVVGLVLSGMLRRWLAQKVLPNTRLDMGVRHSIALSAGYAGVTIAIVAALGALGVSLTSLGLVAGALSVGIGFGLRTLVENFVAGLLLLMERPIKVGDWIVIDGHQGTVKQISVRSTEIETFDRASVILPNSLLIGSPVMNWTHKNRLMRVVIKVGVAYGSDTRKVCETLLRCAAQTPQVLESPEPVVAFMGFGDSSLDFELRCIVADTDHLIPTTTALHLAIDDAFRAEGIAIPFPQRDVNLKGPPAASQADDAAATDAGQGDAAARRRAG